MKKNQSYYNHRSHSGQFYARAEYLKNQTRARIAIAYFVLAVILSSIYEASTSLIK